MELKLSPQPQRRPLSVPLRPRSRNFAYRISGPKEILGTWLRKSIQTK